MQAASGTPPPRGLSGQAGSGAPGTDHSRRPQPPRVPAKQPPALLHGCGAEGGRGLMVTAGRQWTSGRDL